jgi:hypothetical protein
VPELAEVIWFLIVESIFEISVAVAELLKEGVFGGESGEVKGVTGGEDDNLLGKVAIVWIIEAVYIYVNSVTVFVSFN